MYCVALPYIVEYIFKKKRKWDIDYELNTATSKISYPLHLFQSVKKQHFHELYRYIYIYILLIEMHMIVLVDNERI